MNLKFKNFKIKLDKGFTLIEILIVVGIVAFIGGLGILSLVNFQRRITLDSTVQSIAAFLRDAHQKAVNQESSSEWGVHFENVTDSRDFFAVFQGSSYTTPVSISYLPVFLEFSDPGSGGGVYWQKIGGGGQQSSWGSEFDWVSELIIYNSKLYAGLGGGFGGSGAGVWEYNGSNWTNKSHPDWSWDYWYNSVGSFAVFNGKLYAGINAWGFGNYAQVWEYDGSSWIKIGDRVLWDSEAYESISSLTVFNNELYAGFGYTISDGDIWKYNGVDWTLVRPGYGYQEMVSSMVVYNNKLYAGFGYTAGDAEVWEYNGSTWTKIGGDGIGWPDLIYEIVNSLLVFNNKLYAGLGWNTGDAEVWEYNGSSWTKIGGDGINSSWANSTYEYVFSLTSFNGKLYAGLGINVGDAEVWEYNGSSWTKIGGDSINSSWGSNTTAAFSLAEYNNKLYAGLGEQIGGDDAEVWEYTIDVSNQKNIIFQKLTGIPDSTSIVKLNLVSNPSVSKTITVNAVGKIEY